MKDYALEIAAKKSGFNEKLNAMREYLQAYILRKCHDQGLFQCTAFVGGTALRFLYGLPRFSEDLDFSLTRHEGYSFLDLLTAVKRELTLAGYTVAIRYSDKRNVHYAMIKFEGLMHEAGISPLPSQRLSIKMEIDTNPPAGAALKPEVVYKFFPIAFQSYDVPSLLAGKIHALLNRKYTKGRDFFDIGWYFSRWKDVEPNIPLLQNALRQTGWKKEMPGKTDWRNLLAHVVEKADWRQVEADIKNFLENPSDMNIFTKANVLRIIRAFPEGIEDFLK